MQALSVMQVHAAEKLAKRGDDDDGDGEGGSNGADDCDADEEGGRGVIQDFHDLDHARVVICSDIT